MQVASNRSAEWKWWQWSLPLVLFVGVIYGNSLPNGFVFDDIPLIKENPQIRSLGDLASIFGRSGYRPVRTFTYALNYRLSGLEPFYFHLTNVLIHAADVILVFLFLRRLFLRFGAAFAGALLFACHPVQTAAVAYVSGRKDLLACGFLLAGLLCYSRFREGRGKMLFAGTLMFFALALFSKEVAVVFPLLLFGWDYIERWRQSPDRTPWENASWVLRTRWKTYAPMPLAAAGFLYYALVITNASRRFDFWGGSALSNYLTSFKLFAHYVAKALYPRHLIADYDGVFPPARGVLDPSVWIAAAVAGAYAALLLYTLRRRPILAFGLFWFLVCLLPVIQLLPFHEIAADHYLYLPMVGALAAILDAVCWKVPAIRLRWAAPVLVLVVLVFSAGTIERNAEWRDTLTLWTKTVTQAPNSARVQNNLGTTLHAAGRLDHALPHLLRATELDPAIAVYWSNLGALYHDQGDYWAALTALRRAVTLEPSNPYTQTNIGNSYKKLALARGSRDPQSELWQRALEHLSQAVGLNGSNGPLHYNLGTAYYELGMRAEARKAFETAGRVTPQFGRAFYALGVMDDEEGRLAEAAAELERSLTLDPSNLDAHDLLASVLEKGQQYPEARTVLESAVARFPSSSDLRLRLGLLYKTLGATDSARQQLNRALQLNPSINRADEIRRALESL